MAVLGIKPGTFWLVVRHGNLQTKRLISVNIIGTKNAWFLYFHESHLLYTKTGKTQMGLFLEGKESKFIPVHKLHP